MATTYVINGIPTKLESESGAEFVGVVNGIPVFYSLPGGAIIPTPRNLAGVAYSDHIVWTWEAGV